MHSIIRSLLQKWLSTVTEKKSNHPTLVGFTLGARTRVNKVCQPLISYTSKLQRPFVPKATGVFPPVGRAGETANSPETLITVFFFIGIYNRFNNNKSKHIKTIQNIKDGIQPERIIFFFAVSLKKKNHLWAGWLPPTLDWGDIASAWRWRSASCKICLVFSSFGSGHKIRSKSRSEENRGCQVAKCHSNRSKDKACSWVIICQGFPINIISIQKQKPIAQSCRRRFSRAASLIAKASWNMISATRISPYHRISR